jgi:hypothetical protein
MLTEAGRGGMTDITGTRSDGRRLSLALPIYTAAILLSAFLLFSVQPMFARMVTPKLGGAPAVWSVAMVFFQGLLLAGYLYAHLLSRLRLRVAVVVHVAVLVAGFLAQPIGVSALAGDPPESGQALWLIGLFALSVGLPFFAIAGHGPLLQAWFARTGHRDAADPYFLYSASNIGSFASLMLYPLLIEPLVPLSGQATLWQVGYLVLVVLVAGAVLLVRGDTGAAVAGRPSSPAIAGTSKLWFVLMAAVPSGLLVAVTQHIATDVASSPFLWVLPLLLFLLTFVAVFRERPWMAQDRLIRLMVAGAPGLVLLPFAGHGHVGFLAVHLAALFLVALVAHGELYRRRPAADRLTEFYLWMSLGGVIGGIFASLVAPVAFSTVAEYPLLVAAGFLLLPDVRARLTFNRALLALAGLALLAAALSLSAPMLSRLLQPAVLALAVLAGLTAVFALSRGSHVAVASGVAVATALLLTLGLNDRAQDTVRSFFGVHKMHLSADGRHRLLSHGTTVHGAAEVSVPEGVRPDPLAYYHRDGAIAAAIDAARAAADVRRIAVMGLGTGAMACLARPGEGWRYFEIDPSVVEIARDSARFPYLPRCGEGEGIIMGDARLTFRRESGLFDVLVVDVFSSDAIPTHLMTVEAIHGFLERLGPAGTVVLHVSNRHMTLEPVVAAAGLSLGLEVAATRAKDQHWPKEQQDAYKLPADVVVLTRDAVTAERLAALPGWRRVIATDARPWTDDYANVIGAIWRHVRGE